ncbi:flagellar hook-associated protein 1 [Oceanobacillus iheyensis HTE831]|uniref:Flagellar hook-associated protein 1 n=1 Tax=Oceanobacillus iheyensis (strain DSM 14371 / CIP 107618 / JCM 11309 / KCTC 3954 / HTE831) TaxID=221109 RepID=Q8ENH6_OCEIH|nr:flagellar hook-associated protein FlgK [Oceanobacillus iheyensis]BAC14463.1 flagellar hook-associated protein 1 [Oceanobacillus iheyensis HTE831]
MGTFYGLEMSRQALAAQQSALYTTGHNISNANTPGYTRQRVNLEAMNGFPYASRNRPNMPGQMGTGVEAGSVQRIRNQFLDNQFRSENNSSGYWTEKANALSRMENVMNEPSDSGLSKTMNQFWQSLQDLAVNPDNAGARSVVLQRGHALADTFNYISSSMSTIRTDLSNQIDTTVKDANSLIDNIDNLNEQIKNLETHGYDANDLYDKRDVLLDELSGIVNIKVTYDNSHAKNRADGVATVEVLNDSGDSIATLVDGVEGTVNHIEAPTYNEGEENDLTVIEDIQVNGESILSSKGSLSGLVESYGYMEDGERVGDYPEMMSRLDELAYSIATSFNEIHSEGDSGVPFFGELTDEKGAAGAISVILEDYEDINASADGEAGSGDLASDLADIFTNPNDLLDGASINDYFGSIIGDLGVKSEQAYTMQENTMTLQHQVENQRLSISAVSLDEEMSNMIKFQHAYNAAARGMTTMDEMIDTIINRMGLVGR